MNSPVIEIVDRSLLERFLRKDPALHIYEIGDLDPFFWPSTRWFGWAPDGESRLEAVALLYSAPGTNSLLALERRRPDAGRALLTSILEHLPATLHAHLSLPFIEVFREAGWRVTDETPSTKMTLDPELFERCQATDNTELGAQTPGTAKDAEALVRLDLGDLEEVQAFYADAYPANWFDPRMLETGQYFGARTAFGLAAVAGVHVYSPAYRVAALGNVATHPQHRRQGWGTRVTARLCRSLLDAGIETIGLNVHEDNAAAAACYAGLGFSASCDYGEFGLKRPDSD